MSDMMKGMSMDNRPQEQPNGTYPFGKNGIQYDTKGVVQNERGFDPAIVAATNGLVCGVIETDGRPIIFSKRSDIGVSYIGEFDPDVNAYFSLKDDSAFPADEKWDFSVDRYITGEFQRNGFNERIVAWTDKNKPPMMINLDRLADYNSAKDTLLFLQSTTPTIDVDVINGGSLEKAAYFVLAKYQKNDGSETGYVVTSAAAIVSSGEPTPIVDRALNIRLTGLDLSYDKVVLAIVRKKNNEFKAVAMEPVEIGQSTMTIVYTGEGTTTPLTLEEVLVPNAVYNKVGTMGQLNDALYIADLEKEPELNLQKYANLVKVRVKSELIDVVPNDPAHVTGKKRSLMHQEVYALYIRYHRTSGGWTRGFHLPGLAPLAADLAAATGTHETDLGAKVYQVKDTNRDINVATRTCSTGIWVNENETYPTTADFDSTSLGGPDLRGLPVRHHRMPSLAFCKENFYAGGFMGIGNGAYGRTKLDILGLEISNVQIPSNLVGKIDGYEILIAKRSLANSLVLGQSALMLAAQPKHVWRSNAEYLSTGGNWHSALTDSFAMYNNPPVMLNQSSTLFTTGRDLNIAQIMNNTEAARPNYRVRFHSFDMLFNRPAVTPRYLSPQLKMRVTGLNQDVPVGGSVEDGLGADDAGFPVMYAVDYTKGASPTAAPSGVRVRAIESSTYLPNNSALGEYNNTWMEACYACSVKWIGAETNVGANEIPLKPSISWIRSYTHQPTNRKVMWEETYLTNLMDIKPDVYNSFYLQPLVSSGQLVPIGTPVATVYPGDTFLNDYTFHTYGWMDDANRHMKDTAIPELQGGYKVARRIICEAVSNINLRYEDPTNLYSRFWPKSALTANDDKASTYLHAFDRTKDPNQFGYSKDMNALNDFGNYAPFNPYAEDVYKFPFRIHRGGKMPRQGKTRSWRTFLALDYYEAQKNMGRIVRVLGKDDKLLIHHENALFITQDKAKLDAGLLSVTLGAGDIFQFEPQEAMSSKMGYAGNQHELAGVDTPWGYVFVDSKQGQVFLFKDGLKLMNQGLNQFLQEYTKVRGNNPFNGNGITIGYDPEHKRVLLTVRNKVMATDLANFVPGYEPTPEFIAKLTPNQSIVFRGGRYQKFLGVNATQWGCPVKPPPTLSGATLVTTVKQNREPSTVFANVTGLFVIGGRATYSINPEVPGIAVDGTSGDLYVVDGKQIPLGANVTNAIATDDEGQTAQRSITITGENTDEGPAAVDQVFEAMEQLEPANKVGLVTAATLDGSYPTFALEGTNDYFTVDAGGNVLTTAVLPLYSEKSAIEFQVRATGTGGLYTIFNVQVRLIEQAPSKLPTNVTLSLSLANVRPGDLIYTRPAHWYTMRLVSRGETDFEYNEITGDLFWTPETPAAGTTVLTFETVDKLDSVETTTITVNIT